jgi:hypothetical protein
MSSQNGRILFENGRLRNSTIDFDRDSAKIGGIFSNQAEFHPNLCRQFIQNHWRNLNCAHSPVYIRPIKLYFSHQPKKTGKYSTFFGIRTQDLMGYKSALLPT